MAICTPTALQRMDKRRSEVPLVDEGYCTAAYNYFLQKGWNDILLKCPVGSFKGKDQNW